VAWRAKTSESFSLGNWVQPGQNWVIDKTIGKASAGPEIHSIAYLSKLTKESDTVHKAA